MLDGIRRNGLVVSLPTLFALVMHLPLHPVKGCIAYSSSVQTTIPFCRAYHKKDERKQKKENRKKKEQKGRRRPEKGGRGAYCYGMPGVLGASRAQLRIMSSELLDLDLWLYLV